MRRLISLNPKVHCIGGSHFGAPFSGCERVLEVLRQAGLPSPIRHNGLAAKWQEMLIPEASTAAMGVLLRDLADVTAAAISAGDRPLIIGGDHSNAISLLGNEHGMPLAALLSLGDHAVTEIPGPALDPVRIVVIGMCNNEPAEVGYLAVLEEGLIKNSAVLGELLLARLHQ